MISKEFKVKLNNNKLSDYDNLLKRFKNWTQFKREIKLTTLLEGKRIQYDLEDIVNVHGFFGSPNQNSNIRFTWRMPESCFIIKSMSFIIKDDSVDELKITIETINSEKGRLIELLLIESIELDMIQYMEDDDVIYFYIDDYNDKLIA